MRLTKNDMARVIVTALYDHPELVAADHPEVLHLVAKNKVPRLKQQHRLAIAAIESRGFA